MYFETHINIKNLLKKFANLQKNVHSFSLFEVLYNWVKFRRLNDLRSTLENTKWSSKL